MNRNTLKHYAPQARRDFIAAVTDRAAYYGLTTQKLEPMTEQGEVALIGGKPFPRSVAAKRKRLEERIRRQGFEQVMEAMAYTWFNRLGAIRYMELHGYRVLSHPEGKPIPEILEHAQDVDLPSLDTRKVIELKLDGTREAELYRMLLIAQCNALHHAMPFLFERIDDETELLLPDNLLHSDSLIRKLVNSIDEEDWQEVEIIGWLYQFYISEKKDQVIGKVVKSEDIPAATQLFTPNWIVKYLVQNSLGRQWLATYPNSPLKQQMEYYIEPAEQTPEVQEQLKAITPDSLNPEELTLLDPACGSGHILVEGYDLLKAIYQERGYRASDIPRLILEKNLYGLEIDDRAAQLSAFALIMKARADDRRIFASGIQPHVLAIQESKGLDAEELARALNIPILKEQLPPAAYLFEEIEEEKSPLLSGKNLSDKGDISQASVGQLLDLFAHGKTFGSLIRVPDRLAVKLCEISKRLEAILTDGEMFGQYAARALLPIVKQALLLGRKYDVVVANPPFLGSKAMNADLKKFASATFPNSKSDTFAMFIEHLPSIAHKNGYIGCVSPFVWMFLSSYSKLRKYLFTGRSISSLVKPSYTSFFESAIVPLVAFIIRNGSELLRGDYFDLGYLGSAESQPVKLIEAIHNQNCGMHYTTSWVDFKKIPSCPIAFWASEKVLEVFSTFPRISACAKPLKGMFTGNNDRFLRFHWEIYSIFHGCKTHEESRQSELKWYPYQKGGEFRKWYGNLYYVVNFQHDGQVLKESDGYGERNPEYYFKPGLTWSSLSSSGTGFRVCSHGFLFDSKGPIAVHLSQDPRESRSSEA